MIKNDNNTNRSNNMSTTDKATMTKIACNLITKNVENGMSYEAAKTSAMNRLNAECPDLVALWLA